VSFALAGSVITQTGTDTTLSGIEALAGVTARTYGTGIHLRTIYEFSGVRLEVSGSLSFNPRVEMMYFDETCPLPTVQINNLGTFEIAGIETRSGYDIYTKLTAIYSAPSNTSTGYINDGGAIDVEVGGTFLWNGGEVHTGQSLVFLDGSIVRINEGIWYGRGTDNTGLYNQCVIRAKGADLEIRGLRFGGNAVLYLLKTGISVLERLEPVGTVNNIAGINTNQTATTYLPDFKSGQGNTSEIAVGYDARWELDDPSDGTNVLTVGGRSTGSSGRVEIFSNVRFTIRDAAGTPLQNAVVFSRDTDHGDRLPSAWFFDRTYNALTDANGEVAHRVLTGYAHFKGAVPGVPGQGDGYIYKRGKVNDTSDLFDFHVWTYGYQYAALTDQVLKGQGGLDVSAKLLVDTLTTQSNKAIVDAYTHCDSPAKTYDYMRSWKQDNVELPTSSELPLTKAGNILDALSFNINIDKTALVPFAFDGTTITIKADTFSGNIVTTGVAQLLNGAAIAGYITDQNGTIGQVIELGISFSGVQTGSQIKIYEAGTTTLIDSVESSGTTFEWKEVHSVDKDVDYTVIKEGTLPIRAAGISLGPAVTGVQIQQTTDRAYNASSGLVFGTTLVIDAVAKTVAVTAATTVQNLYAACVESWRAQAALENVRFPIATNGPNSFTFDTDWEVTSASIQYLSRDGMRFLNTGGDITATWAAILSSGNVASSTVEYQQILGAAPTNALNTGNIDQLVQVFGDATHGNFDYSNYLVIKSQANGYYEAIADVVGQYGQLEDQLYNIVLLPVAIPDFITGNPAVTGLSLVDHGATPITWNGKDYSITITDTGANTGDNIQRWLNYNKSLDATFEGFEPFNLFDMVGDGTTMRGNIINSAGATLKGVRIVDGSNGPHPYFTAFTADDGTTYLPPQQIILEAPNVAAGRVFLYNVTTATAIDNALVTGAYGYSWANGSDFTAGDTILFVWASDLGDKDAIVRYGQAPASGSVSFIDSPVDDQVFQTYTAELGVGGADITEFIPDFPNLQLDINAGTTFSVTRLYIFYKYILSSEEGIQLLVGAINPIDAGTLVIDVNKVDFHLDSLVAANVTQADKKVLKRSDGLPVPISQPTGGFGISMYHDGSPVVFSTSEGLSASDRALLDSIANTQYDTAALHSDLDTYTNKDAWKGTAGGGGGLDEPGMHTALDNYANKNAFKADVSALATTAQVSAIDTTVDLSALATTAQLAPLATSAEVQALDFSTDLTGIARTTDLAGLATSAEVAALDFTTDLTGIATTAEVNAAAATIDLTGIARTTDLSPLATISQVNAAVATIDLTGLALSSEIDALDVKLNEVHAFTGLDNLNPVVVTEAGSTKTISSGAISMDVVTAENGDITIGRT